jgi:hypothetical protein
MILRGDGTFAQRSDPRKDQARQDQVSLMPV